MSDENLERAVELVLKIQNAAESKRIEALERRIAELEARPVVYPVVPTIPYYYPPYVPTTFTLADDTTYIPLYDVISSDDFSITFTAVS